MSIEAMTLLAAHAHQIVITANEGSLDLALKEVYAVDPEATVTQEFAPGVLLLSCTMNFGEIAAAWIKEPPIFVRHVNPVHKVLELDDVAEWRSALETAVVGEILPSLEATLPFSVQTRVFSQAPFKPFEVNQLLAGIAESQFGLTLDVREPAQVISVIVYSDEGELPVFYVGASLVIHNLSDWAGGMRRFAREEGQISRAEFKLLEAIDIFGLALPARGTVLDLGASPGGWTRVLRNLEQYVTAIDPGELDPRLAGDSGVRHKRITAEMYLDSEPDMFDIIVNDMRMDGRDSARLMTSFSRQLYPHGWALMTVKLPEMRREIILEHTFAILRNAFIVAGARQLFHNRSEITVCLKPLASR